MYKAMARKSLFKKLTFYSTLLSLYFILIVTDAKSQVIDISDSNILEAFQASSPTGSHTQQYYVSGNGFPPNQIIYIAVNDILGFFKISAFTEDNYNATAEIQTDIYGSVDAMLYIKFAPTNDDPHTATISHTSDNAQTQTLMVSGNPGTLPIRLKSFDAKAGKGSFMLNWTTVLGLKSKWLEI
jgi:hypothetical protein